MDGKTSIKKNSDFRRIYAKGKSSLNSYMVVYCRKNRLGRNRLGFTVSAKLGNAVCRNRIRRRLREIVRLNSSGIKTGYDIIVVARRRCVNADYRKMNDAFLSCCAGLEIMTKNETIHDGRDPLLPESDLTV